MQTASSSLPTLAIITPGGDAPGLNSFIYHAVEEGHRRGWRVIGIRNSIFGLLESPPQIVEFTPGGLPADFVFRPSTALGSSREMPSQDITSEVKQRLHEFNVQAMVVTCGDGGLRKFFELHKAGVPLICVPKTVDNNVGATEYALGVHSAVEEVCHSINSARETAVSLSRFAVVETMGRDEGQLALLAGLQSGADEIFIPEIGVNFPKALERLVARYNERKAAYLAGSHDINVHNPYALLVVAEGTKMANGQSIAAANGNKKHVIYGGIGKYYGNLIKEATGIDVTVQERSYNPRGGEPNKQDIDLGRRFALAAVAALLDRKESGKVVTIHNDSISLVPMEEAMKMPGRVTRENPHLIAAQKRGIHFGD